MNRVQGLLSGEQFYRLQRVVGIAIFLVAHLILQYRKTHGDLQDMLVLYKKLD